MSYPDTLKPTPFLPCYEDGVVEWIDVLGFAVPLTWGDPAEEYTAIREAVAGIEFSMLLKFKVSGPGARAAVNAIFSRNVTDLGAGKIAYGCVLSDAGKMVDDVTVLCHANDHFQIICGNPVVGEMLSANAPGGTSVIEHRDELAMLSVQGPNSRVVLQSLTDADLSNDVLPYYNFVTGVTLAGIDAQINRLGFTGELGYEVVIPASRAADLWKAVSEAGAPLGFKAAGGAALMTARIEAGLIMAELDYTGDTSPFECRMGWAVDMDKGEFSGRAALDDLKANARTRVVTIRIPAAGVDYSGAALLADGQEAGFAPVVVPSPLVEGDFLAMATIAAEHAKVGTMLNLAGHDGVTAEIVKMPVFDPERVRVRS